MSPCWAALCQEVCLASSYVLSKTLSSLSADGWGFVAPHWLFVLSLPSTGAYWLLGGAGLGEKRQPPGGFTPMSFTQSYCYQCLCPCSEPQLPPPTSAGHLPILAGRSGTGFYEITALFPVSWCTQDLVCALQEWSFSVPQCCGIPVIKLHWPSKPDSLGSSPPIVRPPEVSLTCGSELLLLWENLWDIIIFQFLGCPPSGYGI